MTLQRLGQTGRSDRRLSSGPPPAAGSGPCQALVGVAASHGRNAEVAVRRRSRPAGRAVAATEGPAGFQSPGRARGGLRGGRTVRRSLPGRPAVRRTGRQGGQCGGAGGHPGTAGPVPPRPTLSRIAGQDAPGSGRERRNRQGHLSRWSPSCQRNSIPGQRGGRLGTGRPPLPPSAEAREFCLRSKDFPCGYSARSGYHSSRQVPWPRPRSYGPYAGQRRPAARNNSSAQAASGGDNGGSGSAR